jgi:hypothetical protein
MTSVERSVRMRWGHVYERVALRGHYSGVTGGHACGRPGSIQQGWHEGGGGRRRVVVVVVVVQTTTGWMVRCGITPHHTLNDTASPSQDPRAYARGQATRFIAHATRTRRRR